MPAAKVWNGYESQCSTLMHEGRAASGRGALAPARIEAHYFLNRMFLGDGHVVESLSALRAIPAVIVQGRYDMICPIATADELYRAWPEADYVIVPDAGHSALEPGIRSALVAATESFKSGRRP